MRADEKTCSKRTSSPQPLEQLCSRWGTAASCPHGHFTRHYFLVNNLFLLELDLNVLCWDNHFPELSHPEAISPHSQWLLWTEKAPMQPTQIFLQPEYSHVLGIVRGSRCFSSNTFSLGLLKEMTLEECPDASSWECQVSHKLEAGVQYLLCHHQSFWVPWRTETQKVVLWPFLAVVTSPGTGSPPVFIQPLPVCNVSGKAKQTQKPLQAEITVERLTSATQSYLRGMQRKPAKDTICLWRNV